MWTGVAIARCDAPRPSKGAGLHAVAGSFRSGSDSTPAVALRLLAMFRHIVNAFLAGTMFAFARPAMSNAVPWPGVVTGTGRPASTDTPRSNPSSFIAI